MDQNSISLMCRICSIMKSLLLLCALCLHLGLTQLGFVLTDTNGAALISLS